MNLRLNRIVSFYDLKVNLYKRNGHRSTVWEQVKNKKSLYRVCEGTWTPTGLEINYGKVSGWLSVIRSTSSVSWSQISLGLPWNPTYIRLRTIKTSTPSTRSLFVTLNGFLCSSDHHLDPDLCLSPDLFRDESTGVTEKFTNRRRGSLPSKYLLWPVRLVYFQSYLNQWPFF